MAQQVQPSAATPRKHKNYAQLHGSCKMALLSDGLKDKECEGCGTVHKKRICPWCGVRRGKK